MATSINPEDKHLIDNSVASPSPIQDPAMGTEVAEEKSIKKSAASLKNLKMRSTPKEGTTRDVPSTPTIKTASSPSKQTLSITKSIHLFQSDIKTFIKEYKACKKNDIGFRFFGRKGTLRFLNKLESLTSLHTPSTVETLTALKEKLTGIIAKKQQGIQYLGDSTKNRKQSILNDLYSRIESNIKLCKELEGHPKESAVQDRVFQKSPLILNWKSASKTRFFRGAILKKVDGLVLRHLKAPLYDPEQPLEETTRLEAFRDSLSQIISNTSSVPSSVTTLLDKANHQLQAQYIYLANHCDSHPKVDRSSLYHRHIKPYMFKKSIKSMQTTNSMSLLSRQMQSFINGVKPIVSTEVYNPELKRDSLVKELSETFGQASRGITDEQCTFFQVMESLVTSGGFPVNDIMAQFKCRQLQYLHTVPNISNDDIRSALEVLDLGFNTVDDVNQFIQSGEERRSELIASILSQVPDLHGKSPQNIMKHLSYAVPEFLNKAHQTHLLTEYAHDDRDTILYEASKDLFRGLIKTTSIQIDGNELYPAELYTPDTRLAKLSERMESIVDVILPGVLDQFGRESFRGLIASNDSYKGLESAIKELNKSLDKTSSDRLVMTLNLFAQGIFATMAKPLYKAFNIVNMIPMPEGKAVFHASSSGEVSVSQYFNIKVNSSDYFTPEPGIGFCLKTTLNQVDGETVLSNVDITDRAMSTAFKQYLEATTGPGDNTGAKNVLYDYLVANQFYIQEKVGG